MECRLRVRSVTGRTTMPTELHEVFEPATIDGLTRRLFELRAEIAAMKSEESNLTTILKEHCEKTGEVVECEGLPPLRVTSRGAGWFWDSTAIRNIQEKAPHEWQRLVELGAVQLASSIVNEALKRGQLVRRPEGGMEKHQSVLSFDKR